MANPYDDEELFDHYICWKYAFAKANAGVMSWAMTLLLLVYNTVVYIAVEKAVPYMRLQRATG